MTNVESIVYYEKLHDIFERVHPRDMPIKIGKLIQYMEDAGEHHSVDVGDTTGTLYDMQSAFELALKRTDRSLLLTHSTKNYEVNIYPIMNFLNENGSIMGELDNLKTSIMTLSHEKNIAEMKNVYKFVDSLSIVFGN